MTKHRKYFSCSDGFCGADDCPRCRGYEPEDEEELEPEEQEEDNTTCSIIGWAGSTHPITY